MVFSIQIRPRETAELYGVNSNRGYLILSERDLSEQKDAIQALIGAYVQLEISEQAMPIRNEKFQLYVAHKPQNEWHEIAEYRLYLNAIFRLEAAEEHLTSLQTKYKVTYIGELS